MLLGYLYQVDIPHNVILYNCRMCKLNVFVLNVFKIEVDEKGCLRS